MRLTCAMLVSPGHKWCGALRTLGTVLFVAAVALSLAAASASQPRILISPLEGPPGTHVEIDGIGFCSQAACSTVTVLFEGLPVARDVRVNADGTFHAEGVVPGGSPPGEIFVVALQADAAGAEISASGGFILTFPPPEIPSVVPEPTVVVPTPTQIAGSPTPNATTTPHPSTPTPDTASTPSPTATDEAGDIDPSDDGVPIALWLGLAAGLPLIAILVALWLLWRRGRAET